MRWRLALGVGLFLLALVGIYILTRPPRIAVPVRQYPPNNAYREIATVLETLWKASRWDKRLEKLNSSSAPITSGDYSYLLNTYQPLLDRYLPLMEKPSKPVLEYDPSQPLFELSYARQYARIQTLLMTYELEHGFEKRAIQRFEQVLNLAHQIGNDGSYTHHFVSALLVYLASEPLLRFQVTQLENRELVLRAIQRHLKPLPQPAQLLLEDKNTLDTFYKTLFSSNWSRFQEIVADLERKMIRPPESTLTHLKAYLTLKSAYSEIRDYYDALNAELKKPAWQRDFSKISEPKHYINTLLNVRYDAQGFNQLQMINTQVQLLGVRCAIETHQQKTGHYPQTLEELNLGDMIIDPYSGKPFIYRVDPQKGFQLYSVGENRVDDGGKRLPYLYPHRIINNPGATLPGDIVPYLPKPPEAPSTTVILPTGGTPHLPLSPPVWFR